MSAVLGSYFRSFSDIAKLIQRIKSTDFQPLSKKEKKIQQGEQETLYATMTATELEDESTTKKARVGHSIWTVIHRLQGFETRFGLKTTVVASLLALPAWLSQSNGWWNENEIWWGVVMAWLIMAPRYVFSSLFLLLLPYPSAPLSKSSVPLFCLSSFSPSQEPMRPS